MGAVGNLPPSYWDRLVRNEREFNYSGNGFTDPYQTAETVAAEALTNANSFTNRVAGWIKNGDLKTTIGSEELRAAISQLCGAKPKDGIYYDVSFLSLVHIQKMVDNPASDYRFVDGSKTMDVAWEKAIQVWGDRAVELIAADKHLTPTDKQYCLSKLKQAVDRLANVLSDGRVQTLRTAIEGTRQALLRL